MQNFSNYNDSSRESCQDSSFTEVHSSPKWGQNITCNLTILIVTLFFLFLCLAILTIILRLQRDLYKHFFWQFNRDTSAGGVVLATAGYCRRLQENHRNGQEEGDIAETSEPYTPLRRNRD